MLAAVLSIVFVATPQGAAQSPTPAKPVHWAYRAPVRPEPPRTDQTPIDAFLQARIERAGLIPNHTADRRTLIRRLALDLTGLPPTPSEIAAFADDPAPDAYEQLVERMLASPHYGERWAQMWLDLARYGDTDGFNFDSPRSMWRWRDEVIDALDRDQPYDRFTVEQLAGDLLPDADERTRIASGFHRNTMFNNEGGVDPDEARWERMLDRASTTATVWLGSTFHCAQCHDHKYDPIAQSDYYGLVAFFATQQETKLEFPTQAQRHQRDALQQQIAELTQKGDTAGAAQRKKQLDAIVADSTLVLAESPDQRAEVQLRIRGSYDARGEWIAAHTPKALHPWQAAWPRNRLGLARWLTAQDNPLFARVHVNRLWGALFGRPLVATPEDFGTQAPACDHPELLDWLATEFARLGFSQKAILRTIVLTDAYRRDSATSSEALQIDPDNRLLARGARFRLPAETVRDVWLSASGLLSAKRGGPPVRPLQADTSGSVAINKADLAWQPSPGEDRWRRGIYTFWRRTAPFVQFAVFDAPSREVCTVQRQRTNTPLQALVGLNDPTAWAAAQALGQRMAAHDGSDAERLAFGYALATGRKPEPAQLARLQQALAAESLDLRWALIANVLLNLDATLTRP